MSMSYVDVEFFKRIEREITSRIEDLKNGLAAGHVQDYADYKHRVGQLKALQDMLFWAQDANREALGLPKDQN